MTSGEDVRRRRAWTVVAVVAWAGFALTLSLSALGWYAGLVGASGAETQTATTAGV